MLESLDQEIQTLQTMFRSERDPDGLAFAPLADAFRRKGQVRQALDLLSDGTSRHPEYVTGHAIATKVYLENGMHAEAEFAARRVLELDPEHLIGLSALATILEEQGDSEEAAAVAAALLSADPGSSEARRLAGSAVKEGAVPGAESDPTPGPAAITELVPETMDAEVDADSLFEDLAMRPVEEGDSRPDEEELAQAMDLLGLSDGEDEGAGEPVDDARLEAMDLGALAPDEPEEVELAAMDLGALAPVEPEAGELEMIDLGALASDEPELEVMDLGALAPDEPEATELEVVDLGALAPDEPEAAELEVMDLGALAPDEPEATELEVMDLGALAPDEPEAVELGVMDLGALAPDEPELEVMDLAALAPDEPELEVMDLAALAPDEPDEAQLEVMDLSALAPDEPELEVMDLGALAPDEPVLEVMDLGALAPDEPNETELEVMDLGALAPDEPSDPTPAGEASVTPKEPSRSGAPVYTRTLADLYVKQGFTDKAIDVLKNLQERDPGDAEITSRIAQLEAGTYEASAQSYAPEAARAPRATGGMPVADAFGDSSGHSEEDVEARARDLAESGQGADEVDTPFAWHDAPEGRKNPETDKDIGLYFDTLLEWENRAES